MCDLNDGKYRMEPENSAANKKRVQNVCMKCKTEKAVIVVRVNDPLCQACFLTYVTHKFRSTLGKARLIQANDNVLFAISGGNTSMAMLRLAQEALSEKAHKRLRFTPAIIHIDESCLNDAQESSSSDIVNYFLSFSNQHEIKFFHFPIFQGFCDDKDTEKTSFLQVFNSIKSLTAKSDFLHTLRMKIISNFAKQANYKKLMVGENSTRLSIKLLSNVAQGRGSTIAEDIGVGDYRYDDLVLIRPMREFSPKEVAFFNKINNIPMLEYENLDTKTSATSSVQRQTEEFILGLQADFPSTVNTVFRTGDKLCSSSKKSYANKCILCNSYFDNNNVPASIMLPEQDIENKLCYGCQLTYKDFDDESLGFVPNIFINKITSDIQQLDMKEKISDYLLE